MTNSHSPRQPPPSAPTGLDLKPESATHFAQPEKYDEMLRQGIAISGESRDFFARGRVEEVRRRLPHGFLPRRVLDFGCGTGDTCHLLAETFPEAKVVGADTSAEALSWARARQTERVSFSLVTELETSENFDLCYLNGVLHHVIRADHPALVRKLHDLLKEGGHLAVFDNNPFNPGARLVMKRIAFDRDARMLTAFRVRRLMKTVGFDTVEPARFLFVFPRLLAGLRFAERWLSRIPIGAQYCVLGRRGPRTS